MKRKRLDRDIWTSIVEKEYFQEDINESDFSGILSVLYLKKVFPDSVWNANHETLAVAASGMKWLQFLSIKGNYLLTAMISAKNEIVCYYVDVIAGYGFDHDDVAYYDDLYLDVIVYTNGNILIDDKDELMNAYKSNKISKELYDLAEDTAIELIKGILKDVSSLKEFCMKYLSLIESRYTS